MARVTLTSRSGASLEVEDSSVDFWLERGYRKADTKAEAPKAPAKKAAAKKSTTK